VHLARGGAAAFAGAMTFSNNSRAIRMHGDADSRDVDRQEGSRGSRGLGHIWSRWFLGSSRRNRRSGWLPRSRTSLRDRTVRGHGPHGYGYDDDWDGAAAPVFVWLRSPSPCPHA
jgi:hypothetical protein